MTFLEIQNDVMDSLNLTSDAARTRVKRSINKKLRELQSSCSLGKTRRTVASGQTSSGDNQMTVSGAKILSVVDRDNYKRVLDELDLMEMRLLNPAEDVFGNPYNWAEALVGATTTVVELYPIPTSAEWLYFDILANGEDLVDDDDEPAFPADFHDALVDGARYEELRKMEKMLPMAEEAKKQFEKRVADLRYFLAKSAWRKNRATDRYAYFGLSARVWPFQNV